MEGTRVIITQLELHHHNVIEDHGDIPAPVPVAMSPRRRESSMRKWRQDSYSDSSMSSQRLEEIVASLMKPIKDNKQNFEVDLSLLEDYLSEAGLRHFNNDSSSVEVVPNFSELALLIQQSAIIYGRKVDFLFQQVQAIAESFGTTERDVNDAEENRQQKSRSKRKYVELMNFEPVELEEAINIDLKESESAKSFSTLPKMFIKLEPRTISKGDLEIKDYKGESIGVVTDYRVNWNMDENGVLCDDLDFCLDKVKRAEKIPSTPVNEFVNHCMSPTDSGNNSDYGTDCSHQCSTTPLPLPVAEAEAMSADEDVQDAEQTITEETLPSAKENLKRKRDDAAEKVRFNKFDLKYRLSGTAMKVRLVDCNFSLPMEMIEKVIRKRKSRIKALNKLLDNVKLDNRNLNTFYLLNAIVTSPNKKSRTWERQQVLKNIKLLSQEWDEDFVGFDVDHRDIESRQTKELRGYSFEEMQESHRSYTRISMLYKSIISEAQNDVNSVLELDRVSCDDGFETDHHHEECGISDNDDDNDNNQTVIELPQPEQSSTVTNNNNSLDVNDLSKRVEAWHSSIKGKLIEAEKRQNFDIFSYSMEVLNVCKKSRENNNIEFSDIVRGKKKEEIARYFFATLLLTNSENVRILKTDPIGCKDFGVKLLSENVRFNRDDALF